MNFLEGLSLGTVFRAVVDLLFAHEKGADLHARLRAEAESEYQRTQEQLYEGMDQQQDQMDKLSNNVQAMTIQSEEDNTQTT